MRRSTIAVIGAGPYGLSLAAHLGARGVAHRVFGRPMQFWSQVANAGDGRYLKSFCLGSDISTPQSGYSFLDYNRPRGLETFEPCAIGDFAAYGTWFQQNNAPWVEAVDVANVTHRGGTFEVTLANGECFPAGRVVVATGLSSYARMPQELRSIPQALAAHTSHVASFADYAGLSVAVVGAGQSALEAAALLHEAGASPRLIVREPAIHWQSRVSQSQSLWRRIRSPITGLGTGPKAWVLTRFPGLVHRAPEGWRTRFVMNHLSAEGAWWLRDRVENKVPIDLSTRVVSAHAEDGRVSLQLRNAATGAEHRLEVDRVVAGTGYDTDVDRLEFLDPSIRSAVQRTGRAPRLDAAFETSLPGLHFVGPASAMSFGPLFRFVAGANYTASVLSEHLVKNA